MRKKRKASPSTVTLITGLFVCFIVACLQDTLPSLLSKMRRIDEIQVQLDNNHPVTIRDPAVIGKLVAYLKQAQRFVPDYRKERNVSETIQVCFYCNQARFDISLLKDDLDGYLINVNKNCYKSASFSSMILTLSEKDKVRLAEGY